MAPYTTDIHHWYLPSSVVASKGILTSAAATGILGFITAILFLFCIPDLDTFFALGAPQPFVQVYALALGRWGSILMTIIAVVGLIMVCYTSTLCYRSNRVACYFRTQAFASSHLLDWYLQWLAMVSSLFPAGLVRWPPMDSPRMRSPWYISSRQRSYARFYLVRLPSRPLCRPVLFPLSLLTVLYRFSASRWPRITFIRLIFVLVFLQNRFIFPLCCSMGWSSRCVFPVQFCSFYWLSPRPWYPPSSFLLMPKISTSYAFLSFRDPTFIQRNLFFRLVLSSWLSPFSVLWPGTSPQRKSGFAGSKSCRH